MPEPIKPKIPASPKPSTDPIIEIVEYLPIGYLLLAFVAGGIIVLAALAIYDRNTQNAE